MRFAVLLLVLCSCFSESPVGGDETSSSGSEATSSDSTTSTAGGSTIDMSESSTESSSTTQGADTSSSDDDAGSSSSSGEEPIEDFALYFDGAASMQSTEAVELALGESFTVEAWLRFDSPDAHGRVITHRGGGTTGWELFITEEMTQIAFGVFDNNGEWTEAVGDDVSVYGPGWHHVAGSKDATMLRVHVDGDLVATQSCPAGMGAPTVPLRVGVGDDPLQLVGVDDIRISAPARYQDSFVPDASFSLDADTLVLVVLDEGIGQAASELAAELSFELDGIEWIPGNTEQ